MVDLGIEERRMNKPLFPLTRTGEFGPQPQFRRVDVEELLRATLRVEIELGPEVFESWEGVGFASPMDAPTPIEDRSSNSISSNVVDLTLSAEGWPHPLRDEDAG